MNNTESTNRERALQLWTSFRDEVMYIRDEVMYNQGLMKVSDGVCRYFIFNKYDELFFNN